MTNTIDFFSTDLDGTLFGDDKAREQFKEVWERLPKETRPKLCYNTGRMLDDVMALIQHQLLPRPDYIICGVGTTIYEYKKGQILKAFSEVLDDGWDINSVEEILESLPYPIHKQPAHFQNAYKSSWFFDDATLDQIAEIEERIEEAGINGHVIYSSSRHLDVVSQWANKGNALIWLLRHLNHDPSRVLVAGDSGNDSAMFLLKGMNGIVVGNAQPELIEVTRSLPIYHASSNEVCANAVLAGLRHYGVLPDQPISEEQQEAQKELLYEVLKHGPDTYFDAITADQLDFIRVGYHRAIDALKKTITPLGFAACSLDDNDSTGTDENYRSVWARDGAITVIGSLPLLNQDEAIHECQRQTLLTLLTQLAPNGQLPINVRIDDGRPEYAGVGGIAAIDGALWVVIAFHAYVSRTRDMTLLRDQMGNLERVMTWLSAHDSNNDALLEIPEAGDWTDLFGRSYNVLYDEVLWYQANYCFGRLLQLLGNERRAGDYMRWARVIKREIVSRFWPSTHQHRYQAATFADQQYSLGDARYLIAQITPFDFSWRCDSFANVLAFLSDVTDHQKAGQTFRFLWGVGINEPYPIANLYPVVHEGEKDWRDYYTVNLLNLPMHYHNGGIWPFVGGHWVRFIHKLGLRDIALQELYRLAEVNKLGVLNEWEFNEWVHGRTGRPMGKAYQAWSASEYIRACHDLHVVA